MSIAQMRIEYRQAELTQADAPQDPYQLFSRWFEEATLAELPEPNAMNVATVNAEGRPAARTLLLKGFDHQGFVFFTNYASHKGFEMAKNPFVALTFYWAELERQVRIEGSVEKVSDAESDEYFHSRPRGSQIGAHVSPQSQKIANRALLEKRHQELVLTFQEGQIPRPEHWGGYRVTPFSFEFWQGRPSRLHDRLCYTFEQSDWHLSRLAP